MRFRAKFLQPKNAITPQAGATLKKIYNVFKTPDGRVEGQDDDLTKALDHRDALTASREQR
jgi:hypothetical protein